MNKEYWLENRPGKIGAEEVKTDGFTKNQRRFINNIARRLNAAERIGSGGETTGSGSGGNSSDEELQDKPGTAGAWEDAKTVRVCPACHVRGAVENPEVNPDAVTCTNDDCIVYWYDRSGGESSSTDECIEHGSELKAENRKNGGEPPISDPEPELTTAGEVTLTDDSEELRKVEISDYTTNLLEVGDELVRRSDILDLVDQRIQVYEKQEELNDVEYGRLKELSKLRQEIADAEKKDSEKGDS